MGKIKALTPEQEAAMPAFTQKWIDIGLSTEPADRPRAEAAINLMYETAGLERPKQVVWCGSPMSLCLTRASLKASIEYGIMAGVSDSVGDSVRASIWASVGGDVWDSVRDSVGVGVWNIVRDSVMDGIWASVKDSVWASVRDSVGASVGASVKDSVMGSVGGGVWDSVRNSVEGSVRASVWGSVWNSVRASVRDSVSDSVRDSVSDSVRDSVWASIMAGVSDSVRDSVEGSVRASVRDSVRNSVYGAHDAYWLAFYAFFRDHMGLIEQTEKLQGLSELAQSAGWSIPCKNVCFVSERHNILRRDDQGRLHCEDGPSVAYPDGWSIYAIHGVRVPEIVVMEPDKITLAMIDSEENAEVRRVMIERYGLGRYLADKQAYVIDACDDSYPVKGLRGARLLRMAVEGYEQSITMIECINSTAEPDGTFRKYHLAVNPAHYGGRAGRECLAAMASTWRDPYTRGLIFERPEDYAPESET